MSDDKTTEIDPKIIESAPELLSALIGLFSNPFLSLQDQVYAIREAEGHGWEGKGVQAWREALLAAELAIEKATGEPFNE